MHVRQIDWCYWRNSTIRRIFAIANSLAHAIPTISPSSAFEPSNFEPMPTIQFNRPETGRYQFGRKGAKNAFCCCA
jgi:hypothetical protein